MSNCSPGKTGENAKHSLPASMKTPGVFLLTKCVLTGNVLRGKEQWLGKGFEGRSVVGAGWDQHASIILSTESFANSYWGLQFMVRVQDGEGPSSLECALQDHAVKHCGAREVLFLCCHHNYGGGLQMSYSQWSVEFIQHFSSICGQDPVIPELWSCGVLLGGRGDPESDTDVGSKEAILLGLHLSSVHPLCESWDIGDASDSQPQFQTPPSLPGP